MGAVHLNLKSKRRTTKAVFLIKQNTLEVNMETEFIPVTNIDITVPKTDIPKSDSFSAEPDNTAEKLRTLTDHIENCDL